MRAWSESPFGRIRFGMDARSALARLRMPTCLKRQAVSFLLALIAFAAPAFAAGERATIPIEIARDGSLRSHLAFASGETASAIIDTAATYPMMAANEAERIGAAAPQPPREIEVLGLTGPRIYSVITVPALQIGSLRVSAFSAASNPRASMPGADAILPLSIFAGDVADFDFLNGQLNVYDGRPRRTSGQQSARTPIRKADGLLFVKVSINGVRGQALIDTGSPVSFVNSAFAEAAKVEIDDERSRILQGASGSTQVLRLSTPRTVRISGYAMNSVDMIVADPALFDHLQLSDEPAMVLGLDLLSLFRVQIDRRRGELVLSAREASGGFSFNLSPRNSRIQN